MGCTVVNCAIYVCIERVRVAWVDVLWLTSDESRTECVKTWSSCNNGRQLHSSWLRIPVTLAAGVVPAIAHNHIPGRATLRTMHL